MGFTDEFMVRYEEVKNKIRSNLKSAVLQVSSSIRHLKNDGLDVIDDNIE